MSGNQYSTTPRMTYLLLSQGTRIQLELLNFTDIQSQVIFQLMKRSDLLSQFFKKLFEKNSNFLFEYSNIRKFQKFGYSNVRIIRRLQIFGYSNIRIIRKIQKFDYSNIRIIRKVRKLDYSNIRIIRKSGLFDYSNIRIFDKNYSNTNVYCHRTYIGHMVLATSKALLLIVNVLSIVARTTPLMANTVPTVPIAVFW